MQREFERHVESLQRVELAPPTEPLEGHDEPDAEWEKLPRLRWDLAHFFYQGRGHLLKVEELYRHENLNPQDTYIPSERRRQLVETVLPLVAHLKRVHELIGDSTVSELNYLVLTGGIEPLKPRQDEAAKRYTREVQRIELAAAKKRKEELLSRAGLSEDDRRRIEQIDVYIAELLDPEWLAGSKNVYEGGSEVQAWKIVDGRFYGARREDMPVTNSHWEYAESISHELGVTIVAWFRIQGTLSAASAQQFTERILTDMIPRRR